MTFTPILLSYLSAAGAEDPVGSAAQLATSSPLYGPLAAIGAIVIASIVLVNKISAIRQDRLKNTIEENKELKAELAKLRQQIIDTERRLSDKIQKQSQKHSSDMEAYFETQEQIARDHQQELLDQREELKQAHEGHELELEGWRLRREMDLATIHDLREFIIQAGLTPPKIK